MQKIVFTITFLLLHLMLMAQQPTLHQLKKAEQQITLLSKKNKSISFTSIR